MLKRNMLLCFISPLLRAIFFLLHHFGNIQLLTNWLTLIERDFNEHARRELVTGLLSTGQFRCNQTQPTSVPSERANQPLLLVH